MTMTTRNRKLAEKKKKKAGNKEDRKWEEEVESGEWEAMDCSDIASVK